MNIALKKCLIISLLLCCCCQHAWSQVDPTLPGNTVEQQLENMAEMDESETEDDSYLQQLQDLRKDPLNLNDATESDLKVFIFLKPIQIQSLLTYRQLLGKFISIYELQAVPGWDVETIQKIRPYVMVGNAMTFREDLAKRFSSGDGTLLARVSQILENSRGYTAKDSTGSKYLGGRQRLFVRYRYQYKNLLQYGILGDKDAGEEFFKGSQKQGFDFYSFHLFARNLGVVKHLAIGDFTVNLGQGLISWQAMAFKKSADVMGIKRQADILRPYNSAGEYNFHRGVGITLRSGNWQATLFGSYRRLSGNVVTDSLNYEDLISSIQNSGYHRTNSELSDKDKVRQLAFGGNLTYRKGRFQVGANAIRYQFSDPLQKGNEPYNYYAFRGKGLTNASIDHSFTFRNTHFFGEVAIDGDGDLAIVEGMITSLDRKVDLSMLYRNVSRSYNSLNANAFTEGTQPINENGLYIGLELRPDPTIRIDMYADMYSFPWLKYRIDRPSDGRDQLLQVTWKPNKQLELYSRFTSQSKAINLSGTGLPMHVTTERPRQNWRTQVSYKLTPSLTARARAEVLWLDKRSDQPENGFLLFTDLAYKPMMAPFSANVRFLYFETDSYYSRMYAFENDVLYSFSIPPLFEKGYRYYLNLNYDVNRRFSTWFRIAQTINPGKTSIGSGYDEILGNHKTEVKLQAIYRL